MASSALNISAATRIAVPLFLGACSKEPLYGPDISVEDVTKIRHLAAFAHIGIKGILKAEDDPLGHRCVWR